MKPRNRLMTLGALLLSPALAAAQSTLVSWGSTDTYVTATQPGQRGASQGVISFNMERPLSPAPENYTGNTFYGGANSYNSMNTGFAVFNNNYFGGGLDTLMFGRTVGVEPGHSLTGVILWKKSDFQKGSTPLKNVNVTSLSYTGLVTSIQSTSRTARFVLRHKDGYMISDDIGLGTQLHERKLKHLSGVNWYAYDPAQDMRAIGSQLETPSFDGVIALGLFLTAEATGTEAINLGFTEFEASGSAQILPKPAAGIALAFIGATLALISYHWRPHRGVSRARTRK